jgi:DNA-binding CsgD family transcriptional regulator
VNAKRDFDIEESRLSRRERQVLDLLAQDKNLYEIAEQLGVSYYTVRNHVQHVLGKMGVHSTLEAVALYLLSQSQDSDL